MRTSVTINSKQNHNDNFVMQAGILAAAGMISRIIGILYRSPLTGVIGTLGMGYFSMAYEIYTIVLLISSYSIPSAISKVIATKLAVREYKNAQRIFRCAFLYVLAVGMVASLLLYFGSPFMVQEEAVPVLQCLAPSIFIYGILGVLRGYFQAHKTMLQTSLSQIIEQLVHAAVSIGAAVLLIRMAFHTLEVPTSEAELVKRAVEGAKGAAWGTVAGVLAGMLFMAALYGLNARLIRKRIQKDTHVNVERYGQIFGMITAVVIPFVLSTAVYNVNSSLNMTLYTNWYPKVKELSFVEISDHYGIFSGLAKTISNIPIAFASAMAAAMIPSIAQLVAAEEFDNAKAKIGLAVKTTMLLSIPSAAGLFVLGKPLTALLFPSQPDEVLTKAAAMLMALALSVVFYALSTLNNSILQGLGKVMTPIYNTLIALAVQTICVVGMLLFTPVDLYALAIANTIYSGLLCLLNQWSVRKAIGYKQELKKSFLLPALAACIMGVAAYLLYQGLLLLAVPMRIAVLPAVIVAVVVYFVALILIGGVTESELRCIPKGYLLVKLFKKIGFLK